MKVRTDIKNIIHQYADVEIGIDDEQRENFLRFQRNVEKVFGLKVDVHEYNKLRSILAFNHLCEEKSIFGSSFQITEYVPSKLPCIYIALHLGCYEEIACYLIRKKGKICVPVTERVYTQETKHYNINLGKRNMSFSQLVFVNIETSTGLRQLIRYAQDGYSILCYMDGNSGIGGMTRSDAKLKRIQFFNATLHVRKGIEFLAKLLKWKVIPVYSHIDDISYQPHITLMPPIQCTTNHSLTESLWKVFTPIIWKHYWQWEAWLYVDEFMEQSPENKTLRMGYVLNTERYLPIVKSGIYHYYDKETNSLVKLGEKLFQLLNNLDNSSITTHEALIGYITKETLVEDLLSKEVIIKI